MDAEMSMPSMDNMDEEMKEQAECMCEGKTIEQLRQLGNYFSDKAYKMSREMEKNVTMEDFEKLKNSTGSEEDGETY